MTGDRAEAVACPKWRWFQGSRKYPTVIRERAAYVIRKVALQELSNDG